MGRVMRSAAFTVAVHLMVGAFAAGARAEVKTGDRIGPIAGRNLVGDPVSTADVPKDSLVVVAFWSIYCKPCVAEISSLIRLQQENLNRLKVIGVNTDGELTPGRVRTFVERYEQYEKKKITYPIIFDEHNQITRQLGVGFLPTILILDSAGTVLGSIVGFDEQDEEQILGNVRKLLPGEREAGAADEAIFDIEVRLPVCGFYDEGGWRESFYGNKDRDKEQDKVAAAARDLAMKSALRRALAQVGVVLAEEEGGDCMQPYGVFLREYPFRQRDCLTNLLNNLAHRKYAKVVETNERWLARDYWIRQKVAVNLNGLRNDLEKAKVTLKPMTVSFVVINMGPMQRKRFEDAVVAQSKFVGRPDFPAYTVYTDQETFLDELKKMDFGDLRVFISEAGEGVIEVEIWR